MLLSLKGFQNPTLPTPAFPSTLAFPSEDLYLLSLLVRRPGRPLNLPDSLGFLKDDLIKICRMEDTNRFVYVTIRHGKVTTKSDRQWHCDGYSARKPTRPDTMYVWSDTFPTEAVRMPVEFPEDFYGTVHDVNLFLADSVDRSKPEITTCSAKVWHRFDTYCCHRRPPAADGAYRSFVRIAFVDHEIVGSKSEQNWDVEDFRSRLVRYQG